MHRTSTALLLLLLALLAAAGGATHTSTQAAARRGMSIYVEVENSAGVKQGTGPIVSALSFRQDRKLNRSGRWTLVVPGEDPGVDDLTHGNYARVYTFRDNTRFELGGGPIEKVTREKTDSGYVVRVEGYDWLRELNRVIVNPNLGNYAFSEVKTVPSVLINIHASASRLPNAWTLEDKNGVVLGSSDNCTDEPAYVQFRGETVLNGLLGTARALGEYFRLEDVRTVRWLGAKGTFQASGYSALLVPDGHVARDMPSTILPIAQIREVEDGADTVNRVFPQGAGDGDSRLTLAAANHYPVAGSTLSWSGSNAYITVDGNQYTIDRSINYVRNDVHYLANGNYERLVQFPDIAPITNSDADLEAAADQLLYATVQYIREHSVTHRFLELTIPEAPDLDPGTTIRVTAKAADADGNLSMDVEGTYNILSVSYTINREGLRTARLLVSTGGRYPVTGAQAMAGNVADVVKGMAHPQLNNNVDTIAYREPFDDSNSATLLFWLGDEVVKVQSVILRYSINPLRSQVKASDAESAHTHSVSLVDHTHSIPNHIHKISIANVSPGTGYAARIVQVGSDWAIAGESLGTTPQVDTWSGSGSTTSAAGGGTTTATSAGSAHSHAMSYGVFEESSANTYTKSEVQIVIDGADRSGSATSTGVSGWYELDLTQWVVDSVTGRPKAEWFTISIYPKTSLGKSGRIDAQLQIRTVISNVKF